MKWSWFGRAALALTSAVSLGLSMTACGGGTVAYLWAVGNNAQNQAVIVGYKVDHFTGNLTGIPGQPFSAYDSNPVTVLLRPGGRFLYVINQGVNFSGTSAGTSEGVDLFSIGGEGALTFEQHYTTQGFGHIWATFDSTGNYLFVLDKYNPKYQPDPTMAGYDPNGAITTFSSDATTGRLNLQLQAASTQPGQISPNYLEVGQNPLRMAQTGACLYTINSVGQNVTTYSIANGQLGTVTTGLYTVGSKSMTSIAGNGQFMFITDNGMNPGRIFNFTIGSSCALVPFTSMAVTDEPDGTTNPTNVFLSTSNKYVYVLNANNTNTATTSQGSTLSGYNIVSSQLQPISGSPFPAGSAPQCMVEDPTSEYLYTANGNDGTITGYIYSDPNGQIAPLSRGSSFQTGAKTLSCLALSGSV